ncbi:MAG: PDZ domain-containing protein, partial [Parafilimonas sp.]
MNTHFKSITFALMTSAISLSLFAQDEISPDSKDSKTESIIIRKKGDSKEKLNIIVDGDKITVNGKPLDEFQSEDIEIRRDKDNDFDMMNMPRPPMPPGKPEIFRNYMKTINGNHAFLGVMTEVTKEGAKITDVTKESPAEKAGLKEGDIITKVDNENISSPDDLYKAIGKHKENDKAIITYKRNDKEYTATATLTQNKEMHVYGFNGDKDFDFKIAPPEMPNSPYFFHWNNKPRLGVQAQDTEDGKGVKVLEVEDESPAEKAGLKEDDVITQVNNKAIASVDDLKESVKDVKDGDTVKLTYRRNNQT